MIDKQQVKLHFSKNALNYDKYANVQQKMGDILMKFMLQEKYIRQVNNILEIGCGTGYLTGILKNMLSHAHITAVDIAPGMIAKTKAEFKNNSIDFICGDIENMDVHNTYDIIVSNATFQWFNHMNSTIKKLYGALNSNGILCFSTFGEYTFRELNKCFEMVKQDMGIEENIYSGQKLYSFKDLSTACRNITDLVDSKETWQYEYFSSCKDFFKSVKKTGASNSNKRGKNISPTFMGNVINCYNKNFRQADKIKVTYHCLFYKMIKQTVIMD